MRVGAMAARWMEYCDMKVTAWEAECNRRIDAINAREATKHAVAVRVLKLAARGRPCLP